MLVTSVLVACLIGFITFQRIYHDEVQASTQAVRQLAATVKNTVSIAAYLQDQQLAREVADGLLGNDIVQGVAVHSGDRLLIDAGVTEWDAGYQAECLSLSSPFVVEEQVGSLCLYPSRGYFEQRATQRAGSQIGVMLEFGVVLMLLLMTVMHRLFSQPIKLLSQHLHSFTLNNPQPLAVPKFHQGDEIGALFEDSNKLLGSVAEAFKRERALRQEMEQLENQFRHIFEQASSGIAILDLQGTPKVLNPSFEAMIGAEAVAGICAGTMGFEALAVNRDELARAVVHAAHTRDVVNTDIELAVGPRQGAWVHLAMSRVDEVDGDCYLEVLSYDVSERREREAQFRLEAEHDPLTGVLNRRAGIRRIESLLQDTHASGRQCAIFMLDLDRFKPLNDAFGHDAGDHALIWVAERLRKVTRSDDIIVRWGGDEFLLAVELPQGLEDADQLAERILQAFEQPLTLPGGQRAGLGASIGIAISPQHGNELAILIQYADQAMYAAKIAQGNQRCFFQLVGES